MQEIYFLARHTPFWGVALLVIGAEFAYMFWLKKKKRKALVFLFLSFIGLASCSVYFWAGGPEKTVKLIKKIHRYYKI
jgi:hypothetical protein